MVDRCRQGRVTHMWRTQIGSRVLAGAEWSLFREGVDTLWDQVEDAFRDPDIFETGVAVFDRLQPNQRLAAIAWVAKALHDETEPTPALSAVSEGTVAAVFAVIR